MPTPPSRGLLLCVIALGGGIGALARYAAGVLFPGTPGGFPLTTLLVNVLGCALFGALSVLLTHRVRHPLARPFFGTGLLGGFTTFSTSVVDAEQLLRAGQPGLALLTLFGTLLAALLAVWLGVAVTERILTERAPAGAR
ncbi:fluoride efflux transporter FluC [Sciscionella sediminilitoris]|uniref:fluoride efflux transporter FluC n=1 Tax=Sciscionella sediminilitoris TaxID=1445613 RepID=UPI0004DF4280|nr:CrcB family protein [Sciscionella sp. SE31]